MLKHRLAQVMLLIALSATLVLGGCYQSPEKRAEHFVKHMAEELKLNDAQTAHLEMIKDEFLAKRPEMVRMREETVKEANDLMKSPEIDKTKLNDLTEKNIAHADEMIRFISAKFVEIHDMLTPEQRERLVSQIEKYMSHRREKSRTEEVNQ